MVLLLLSWLPTLQHLSLLLLLCMLGALEMIMSMSVKMTGSCMYKESPNRFFLPLSFSLFFLANMIFHLTSRHGDFFKKIFIYLHMNHNQ